MMASRGSVIPLWVEQIKAVLKQILGTANLSNRWHGIELKN